MKSNEPINCHLAASNKYRHSEKGKLSKMRDENSVKGKLRRQRYLHSEKGWEKLRLRARKYAEQQKRQKFADRYKRQKEVLDIIERSSNRKLKREHTFFDLKDTLTNRRLRVDGCFEDGERESVIIELNGAQHYLPIRFGNISQSRAIRNLHDYQRRERIKQQYCMDNSFKFVCIPFYIPNDSIIDFFHYQLEKNQHKVIVEKTFDFAYAHRLNNDILDEEDNQTLFEKCNNKNFHGHNALLKVAIKGFVDPLTGMVINFNDLKRIVKKVLELFDHKNLNLDFEDNLGVTTCENTIRKLWELLSVELPNLYRLELSETNSSLCVLRREDLDLREIHGRERKQRTNV